MTRPLPPALQQVSTTGQGSSNAPVVLQERHEALLEKAIMMLLAFSRADAVVKSYICTRDCMQQLMDSLGKLQQPHLTRVGDALHRASGVQHGSCFCAYECEAAIHA